MLNSVVCHVKGDSIESETDIPVGTPSKLGLIEHEVQDHMITSPEEVTIRKLQEKSDNNIAIVCASNQKPSKQYSPSNTGDLDPDENDDGFRTPTSLDHRIPVTKQCPPPPRKTRVFSRKRKLSSPVLMRTTIQLLDASQEIIDSMFSRREDKHHKIKKARN